jgi:hypoxanthine phosphoribosyltransferase
MPHTIDLQEYNSKIKRVLITEEELKAAIKKAGPEIDRYFDGYPLLLVSILKGSFLFAADLCRELTVPCEIAFMCARSYYGNTSSTGTVNITMDIDQDLSRYNVVIVEDIVDSGRTLTAVVDLLKYRNPHSLHVVTLLDKPSRRVVDFKADISLFTIPDEFVIGYGFDGDKELYRNLPYIATSSAEE